MNTLTVSICVPAYNEEKNIQKILDALRLQKTDRVHINKIIIVSSGSTDTTNKIVKKYCKKYSQFHLIHQTKRTGKASAINRFLQIVDDEVVVIESADTIPMKNTIEKLCEPFLNDKKIGITGGE